MTRFRALLLSIPFWLACAPVQATTFVPVSAERLARSSRLILIGSVTRLTGVEGRGGRIFTLVEVDVERVLKGTLAVDTITLRERGGEIEGMREVIFGAPRFVVGERVLLFLSTHRDGSLRTNHLALGKFRVELDEVGASVAVRDFDEGSRFLVGRGRSLPSRSIALESLLQAIVRSDPAPEGEESSRPFRTVPPEACKLEISHEGGGAFTLLGPSRFFEADQGTPLAFLIDQEGDVTLGLDASRSAVVDALLAWTSVSSASISLQDGGLTNDTRIPCDGPHKVRFNDPDEEIDDPIDCEGVLGMGGFCSTSNESKSFGGQTFTRATRAALTFANGFGNCPDWTPCNVAEVATHEVGHAIGMGHSSESSDEPSTVLADATMYFRAHFDGRCADLRQDDVDGVSFVYPTAIPPTITTPDPLPTGVVLTPYHVVLVAMGGSGGFDWSLLSGGFPGLMLQADGRITGSPTAFGRGFFQVKASDQAGASHTKVLNIEVAPTQPTPSRTPTQTSTASVTNTRTQTTSPTSTRTATPTSTRTATVTAQPSSPTPTMEPTPPRGDANCDGVINAADVTSLLLRIPTNDTEPCGLADAEVDQILDGRDLIAIVAAIFG